MTCIDDALNKFRDSKIFSDAVSSIPKDEAEVIRKNVEEFLTKILVPMEKLSKSLSESPDASRKELIDRLHAKNGTR